MARETKVGLLAGLAFIICFAIILANQGRRLPATARTLHSLGHTATPSNATDAAPSAPAVLPAASPARLDAVPTRGSDLLIMTSDGELSLPGEGTPPAARRAPSADAAVREPPLDVEAQRRSLQTRLDELSAELDAMGQPRLRTRSASNAEAAPSASRPTATPAARQRRYTVVPGDSLTGIAMTHYGTRSRTVINAVFDANRAVLSNLDDLQVGVELVLPVLDQDARSASPIAGQPAATDAVAAAQPGQDSLLSPGFRWYQVARGDRYVSIAREQLGNASRWHEIYELNRGKFPDPQLIREGVRIKIPTDGGAPAPEGRP